METYVELGIPANRRIPKIAKTNLVGASDYPCLLHIKGRKIRDFADVAVSWMHGKISYLNVHTSTPNL